MMRLDEKGVDHPLWREADAIYQRWTKEEFDIDGDKAMNIFYSFWTEEAIEKKSFLGGGNKKKKVGETRANILDRMTSCLTDWSAKRLIEPNWISSGRELIQVYNVARAHQVLVPGLAVRRDLQNRERQIADLSAELEKTRKKLFEVEKHFKDCNDHTIELEGKLAERQAQEEVQRQIDIRDSLSSESSAVRNESGGEESPQ